MAIRINGTTVIDDNQNATFAKLQTEGTGSFGVLTPPTAYGSISGFTSAGDTGGNNPGKVIDKFPFASDTNATSVGNLANGRSSGAGVSSSTTGYTSGGQYYGTTGNINKFSMVSDGNGTNIGSLTAVRFLHTGHQSQSQAYFALGRNNGEASTSNIEKFPFATETGITATPTTLGIYGHAGQSSITHGYISGGKESSPLVFVNTDKIYKFSFGNEGTLASVGNLTVGRYQGGAGQSSSISGYTTGGVFGPARYNTIDKFPFATDSNATDVGDLTAARSSAAGQSSTTSGYVTGGGNPAITNQIEKFPFATDSNATDIADLTVARSGPAGHQI